MAHEKPVLPQSAALALGVAALRVAVWGFPDAYASRGGERPAVLRLLPV